MEQHPFYCAALLRFVQGENVSDARTEPKALDANEELVVTNAHHHVRDCQCSERDGGMERITCGGESEGEGRCTPAEERWKRHTRGQNPHRYQRMYCPS